MDPKTAAQAYRSETIESAPPIKIVRLLYQGALRFLDRAALCDPADPRSEFTLNLARADDIVAELRCALAPEHAPELCANLERLYLFAEGGIARALAERSREPIAGVRSVLATLLEAWQNVELEAHPSRAPRTLGAL